jgi:hypothetical protein
MLRCCAELEVAKLFIIVKDNFKQIENKIASHTILSSVRVDIFGKDYYSE